MKQKIARLCLHSYQNIINNFHHQRARQSFGDCFSIKKAIFNYFLIVTPRKGPAALIALYPDLIYICNFIRKREKYVFEVENFPYRERRALQTGQMVWWKIIAFFNAYNYAVQYVVCCLSHLSSSITFWKKNKSETSGPIHI